MLVLSRKAGEAIVLGGNITVYVLGVEGDRVKLGVDAPPEVLVLRSELLRNQYPMEQAEPAPQPQPDYRPQPGYSPQPNYRPQPGYSPQPDYRRPRPSVPRPIGARPQRYSRPPWNPGRPRENY
ncbi:MAG: carbon storage regulator [Ktedonobacterales bacterium]